MSILKICPVIELKDLPTLETAVLRYRSEIIDSIDRILVALSKAKESAIAEAKEKLNGN